MRLIIAFDGNFHFLKTDLVIGKKKPMAVLEKNFYKVSHSSSKNYSKELEKEKDLFFTRNNNIQLNNVFNASISNFNRNILNPLFAWIEQIEQLLPLSSEIIILGYSKNVNYIPYYEAEGEITKPLFYKNYDSFPVLIESYLKSKKVNYKKRNKHSSINLRTRIFLRRYPLLVFKAFLMLRKNLLQGKSSYKENYSLDTEIIFSTRSLAHTEYALKFLQKYNSNIFIHVFEGYQSHLENYHYLKKKQFRNILLGTRNLTGRDIFSALWITFKTVRSIPKNFNFNINGIDINLSSSLKEMSISYFDALLYQSSIRKCVHQNTRVLITGEMYTPFAYTLALLGKQISLKTIQLQTTSMIQRLEPAFVYCNKFYMNSFNNKIAFQSLYPNFKKRIDFAGSLLIDEEDIDKHFKGKKLNNVIYFTQPVIGEKEEEIIINGLVKLSSDLNFNLKIRLHPRDNIKKISHHNFIEVIEPGLTFQDYIKNCDLAVIQTTSVGLSLLIEGIPFISCLINKDFAKANLDYIDHNYYGTVFHLEDLQKVLMNYDNLLDEFYELRKNFLIANKMDLGVQTFYKNIQ